MVLNIKKCSLIVDPGLLSLLPNSEICCSINSSGYRQVVVGVITHFIDESVFIQKQKPN